MPNEIELNCHKCGVELPTEEIVYRIKHKGNLPPALEGLGHSTTLCRPCFIEINPPEPWQLLIPNIKECSGCDRKLHLHTKLGRNITNFYCSDKCHQLKRNERARKAYTPVAGTQKICVSCGEAFKAKRRDAKTCSARCRKSLNRLNQP